MAIGVSDGKGPVPTGAGLPGVLLALAPSGSGGGAEKVLARALTEAARRGWSVRCLCPLGPLSEGLARDGIAVTAIPELRLPGGYRPLAYPRLVGRWLTASVRLRRLRKDADVVLVNGIMGLPAVKLARGCWGGRPAVVLWVHEVLSRPDRIRLTRMFRKVPTTTVTVSRAAAQGLAAAEVDARVIPNGTPWPVPPAPQPDASSREPGTSSAPLVIGCAAALTPGKGHEVLLEALATLERTDVVLELAGAPLTKDAEFAARIATRAGQGDLAGRVRLLGQVEDVLSVMRHWTVAVLPSSEPEASPLAVLEAMSIGVPVVATDIGGTPEVLGHAGLLVPAGDPGALAGALDLLLGDPALRRRCADAGRDAIGRRHRADHAIDQVLALVGETIRPRSGSRVVVVVPDFDPTLGGTSRQARQQAADLRRRGVDTLVLTRRRRSEWPDREVLAGVPVRRLGPTGSSTRADKMSVLAVAWWLAVRRRQLGMVEVIMYPDYAWAAAVAGLARRTVMIWASLGDPSEALGPAHSAWRRLQRRLRFRALVPCRHVALTAALEEELRSVGIYGVQRIPVPVDTDRFCPPSPAQRAEARAGLGLAEDELAIVYTGHLRRLKGLDRLIEAFAGLIEEVPMARLYLVGAGSGPDACEADLRRQVARLGAAGAGVVFTGAVDNVERYLWAADIFVLPSRREGLSNSLAEAMACGVACVAGPEAGGDEVLAGGAGVIPRSNEAQDLIPALRALAADPEARRSVGRAAADRAADMSTEKVGSAYMSLYRSLANGR